MLQPIEKSFSATKSREDDTYNEKEGRFGVGARTV